MKKKPIVLICGHIHEGAGVDIVDETPCLNAGSLLTFRNNKMPASLSSTIISRGICRYYTVVVYRDMVEISEFHIPIDQTQFPMPKIVYTLKGERILMRRFGMTFKIPATDTDPPRPITEKSISREAIRVVKKQDLIKNL